MIGALLLHAERLIAFHHRWARHLLTGCRTKHCARIIARECGLGGPPGPMGCA